MGGGNLIYFTLLVGLSIFVLCSYQMIIQQKGRSIRDNSWKYLDMMVQKITTTTRFNATAKSETEQMFYQTNASIWDKSHKAGVYLQSISRFGNVMFEYASLYGIARHTGKRPVFVPTGQAKWLSQLFSKLSIPFARAIPKEVVSRVLEKSPNKFDPDLFNIPDGQDVQIGKWLGSWKYSMPEYTMELKQEFQLTSYMKHIATEKLVELTAAWQNKYIGRGKLMRLTYVGVHVRRGDKVHIKGWGVPPVKYFKNAAAYFRDNFPRCVFVVATEDVRWCKHNLNFPDFVFTDGSPILDIAILSLCNHTIMSIGTFSWWAAWLAGGTTVYYKDHVKPGSNPFKFYNDKDYFLPHWIPMT